jgi:hypothetical protein
MIKDVIESKGATHDWQIKTLAAVRNVQNQYAASCTDP